MTAKDLKNALLQEAVQGKLVPQIASEGNARDLLEEIRKARGENAREFCKAKLGSERKRTDNARSKSHSELVSESIPEDEIPFDIPESWCWCRQSDIAYISTGMTPLKSDTKFYENGTIPWITSSLTNNEVIENADSFITEYALENTSLTLYPKNTLILAMYGQGKTRGQISELLIPATINQACAAIELLINDEYFRKYIKIFHNWNYNNVRKEASGSAQPNLNLGKVQTTLIPLPPLAEQKRIVAAIEKFMPLIEEYGKKETVLNQLNAQIGTLTKKAILQEAVQGKLVPQIPSEGNAKDLLEQIKAQKAALIKEGKIKKEKPLPEITEDEIPFDIPENWCWCRFNEIFQIINGDRGKNYPAKSTLSKNGIPFISALNLENNSVLKDYRLLCVSETQFNKLGSGKLKKNDMVVCIRGSLGKHGIYPFEQGAIASSLVIVREYTKEALLSEFLNIYLDSALFFQEITDYDNGTAQPNLAAESFKKFLFPLPPLSEQKRIVAAIDQLLPLCEKLGK